jgi:thiamine kinase-like enzyme
MMKNPVSTIHGNTLEELQILLHSSSELIQSDVVLDASSLGGWSNINIRGISQGYEFVLKLPWSTKHYDTNPYSKLYNLLTYISRSKLTAPPIAIGRLPDKNETPYMLLQFFEGTTYSSITDASTAELQVLKDTLHKLSLQRPPGLSRYKTPFDYLQEVHSVIAYHEFLATSSTEIIQLLGVFQEQYSKISPIIEALEIWSGTTMHGDLWEPNILFHDGRVLLLDFESCSYGDSLYDIAYLLEASNSPPREEPSLLLHAKDRKNVKSYRLIALMALISWSLNRLLFMDANLVEQNLSSPEINESILKYTRTKISRLISLMN